MSIEKTFVASKSRFKVTFRLDQDFVGNGKQIQVLGDFNQWDSNTAPALKKSKGGYTSTLELEAGKYAFRYLIDGNIWVNDAAADAYEFNAFANDSNGIIILENEAESMTSKKSIPAVKHTAKITAPASAGKTKNTKATKSK